MVCAGTVGQAHRLDGTAFVALPEPRIDGQPAFIEDVAGNGARDLVAVTLDRAAAWFDGSRRHELDLPAEVKREQINLNGICAVGADRYAIAGTHGVWSFAGQTIGFLTDTGWHTVLSCPAPSS